MDETTTRVDFTRPVLMQIVAMAPENYWQWIETKHHTGSDMRIFQWSILEVFSRWPWWSVYLFWIPVMLWNVGLYSPGRYWIPAFTTGWFLWICMEYTLHRFLFHRRPHSRVGAITHLFLHGFHHLTPLDSSRLTFPIFFSAPLGIFTFYLVSYTFGWFMEPWRALYAGIVGGYVFYDTVHYYFHHATGRELLSRIPLLSTYWLWMRKRHSYHHYKEPAGNFGVSCPLLDFLCGTEVYP